MNPEKIEILDEMLAQVAADLAGIATVMMMGRVDPPPKEDGESFAAPEELAYFVLRRAGDMILKEDVSESRRAEVEGWLRGGTP